MTTAREKVNMMLFGGQHEAIIEWIENLERGQIGQMIEDKLTRDERIRLEALAQANASIHLSTSGSEQAIINKAKAFETYIRGEEDPNVRK